MLYKARRGLKRRHVAPHLGDRLREQAWITQQLEAARARRHSAMCNWLIKCEVQLWIAPRNSFRDMLQTSHVAKSPHEVLDAWSISPFDAAINNCGCQCIVWASFHCVHVMCLVGKTSIGRQHIFGALGRLATKVHDGVSCVRSRVRRDPKSMNNGILSATECWNTCEGYGGPEDMIDEDAGLAAQVAYGWKKTFEPGIAGGHACGRPHALAQASQAESHVATRAPDVQRVGGHGRRVR